MATDEQRRRLGRLLAARRESQRLDRKELASRSGLSYPYVSQLENGDREPSLKALHALAAALEAPVGELLATLGGAPGELSDAPSSGAVHDNPLFFTSEPRSSNRRSSRSASSRAAVDAVLGVLAELPPDKRFAVVNEVYGVVLVDLVEWQVRRQR